MSGKNCLAVFVCLVLVVSLSFVGCVPEAQEEPAELRVVTLINGTLGDKSFFDSAAEGMRILEEELGIETEVVEMGLDPAKWEPALIDVSGAGWDIVIVGTWQMVELLERVAPEHPDQKYIIFDSAVDYDIGSLDNVHSILYRQNEGSFLAGALAAMVTNSDMPLANEENYIGFLGGMDIPVINDFLVGYIQGAKHIDPNIRVAVSYVGCFGDPATGKELALAQYVVGVDIGFNVAGRSGLGQIEAAEKANRYVIGVDADQALLFAEHDPDAAELILTSMLKRVDKSLVRAVELYKEGRLEFGKAETVGLKEGAVGLADNEFFRRNVPSEMITELEELEAKIIAGEIVVDTALGMSSERLDEIRNAVRL